MHIILARELVILWPSVAKDSQQLPWKNRLLRLLRSCWLGSFIGLSWHPGAEVDLAHAASRDCQARHVCNLSCSEFSSHYPPRSTVAGDPGVPRPRGLGILRREAQHGKPRFVLSATEAAWARFFCGIFGGFFCFFWRSKRLLGPH